MTVLAEACEAAGLGIGLMPGFMFIGVAAIIWAIKR